MKILGLYSGKRHSIGPKLSPTGIYKKPRDVVELNTLGIIDDVQVDKRFHGGPERALHQFSLQSYQRIIQRFPLLYKSALPGSIGENIVVEKMNEDNVCIGDIYAVGTVILQVSGPRIPCWKIDEKFKQPKLQLFIRQYQLSGWYFRVLKNGQISIDDEFKLLERPQAKLSIRYFLSQIDIQPKTAIFIEQIKHATELDPDWLHKLL